MGRTALTCYSVYSWADQLYSLYSGTTSGPANEGEGDIQIDWVASKTHFTRDLTLNFCFEYSEEAFREHIKSFPSKAGGSANFVWFLSYGTSKNVV